MNFKNTAQFAESTDCCSGCGVCSAVCPTSALTMSWATNGVLRPSVDENSCTSCNFCLKVCPFATTHPNEMELSEARFSENDAIRYSNVAGFYHGAFVGAVSNHELHAQRSSGGLATAFIKQLLTSGEVNGVACVDYKISSESGFDFSLVTDSAHVDHLPGSVYCQCSIAQVLRTIMTNKGQFAVMGTPCLLKGVQRVAELNHDLASRISWYIGFACGKLPGLFQLQYLLTAIGAVDLQPLSVRFRNNKIFSFQARVNGISKSIVWNDCRAGELFARNFFCPRACSVCDDHFAEVADIVFMDAWLPEYHADKLGQNLVISRSENALRFLRQTQTQKQTRLAVTDIQEVEHSQSELVRFKREMLSQRLRSYKNMGLWIPEKRISPSTRLALRDYLDTVVNCLLSNKLRSQFAKLKTANTINSFEHKSNWVFSIMHGYDFFKANILSRFPKH